MLQPKEVLFQKIIKFFEGEFDNFQQAWQENTEDDIHQVTEKRIEVNLRKVLTGWTFIEPGFNSSNHQNWEEEV